MRMPGPHTTAIVGDPRRAQTGRFGPVVGALLALLIAQWLVVGPTPGEDRSGAAGRRPDPANRASGKPLPTDLGQWWQPRGNRRLTGRSSVRGNIATPAILWKHSMGARQTLLATSLVTNGGAHEVLLPRENTADAKWEHTLSAWGVRAPWVDLDGDGSREPLPSGANSKAGRILPALGGWQLVTTAPENYPDSQPYLGTVTLHVRDKQQWVPKWKTETDTLIWSAEPIFGDFDDDGRPEIACLPWYKMNILDAATGEIEEQCHYLHKDENPGAGGRAYGWFGAYDVDNTARDEFIILDDFTMHMEVLAWRNGELQRLWSKRLRQQKSEANSTGVRNLEQQVSLRVNPEPVQDVDGDRHREIVISTYNISDDQRWHVWVLDPLTGKIRWDLPGMFLSGLRDTDGDGVPELFCTRVDEGLRIPSPANLSLISLKGGELVTRWEKKNASWQTYKLPEFPANVNSGASLGAETVLCGPVAPGERNVFFTLEPMGAANGIVEVTGWQAAADRSFHAIGTLRGPRLSVMGLRAMNNRRRVVLLSASSFDGERSVVSSFDATAEIRHSRRLPAPVCPVVVGRLEPGSPPTIIAQGANETVEAIRPAPDGTARLVWRAPGRGMTCNNFWEGLLLADLAGDGTVSTVVGTRGDGDCARLTVLSASGEVVWKRDFAEFPGTPPPWNVPGLMYWQAGYFSSTDRMDLLVQMRVLGGLSYMINGRDGKTMWRRETSVPGRTFGRNLMTMYDFDGDGFEDVLNTFPDLFCVAQGRTGKLLLSERAGKFVPGYGYYGTAIVADFLGKGEDQLLFSSPYVMALLERNGKRIWHGSQGQGSQVRAGMGDADGDGGMDLFLIADKEGKREFQCRTAATGHPMWNLPLPGGPKPTDPATADIDGDGKDECVFTIGDTIYAVGAAADGRSGKIAWTRVMPGHLSAATVADVVGDGHAQIVVSCSDGSIYGIGPATLTQNK